MGLRTDLDARVGAIFRDIWEDRNGLVVPGDAPLGNVGIHIDAAVLYADLGGSTKLVDEMTAHFSAEIYKSFLYCCARIIASEGGVVTAYDGDRIMAVYVGKAKCTSAVRTALKIRWAVNNIITPAMKRVYKGTSYEISHTVGVDTSELMVTKTGARGANDLVWVGSAANHAAKLSDVTGWPTVISADVFDLLHDSIKKPSAGLFSLVDWWTPLALTTVRGRPAYGSFFTVAVEG